MLVQTPRLGYATSLACERCRTPARCAACQGPLALTGSTTTAGVPLVRHRRRGVGLRASAATAGCGRRCSATRAPPRSSAGRSPTPGSSRAAATACCRRSGPGRRSWWRHPAPSRSRPRAYAAVVLLDTWLLLSRVDLRAAEEALRRWVNAAGAGAPRWAGRRGRRRRSSRAAVAGALGPCRVRRPRDRGAGRGPPAAGQPAGDDHWASRVPSTTRSRCSPLPRPPRSSGRSTSARGSAGWWSGCPRAQGPALSRALGELQRVRSSRKLDAVRIQVDPQTL